jgi:hypothetical protein
MDLEDFGPIYGLLIAVALIFGTFQEFATGGSFGFAWFLNMLWFVIGFPVLIIIGMLVFSLGIKGQKKLSED